MSTTAPPSPSIDYPELFTSADQAAAENQRLFFLLKVVELGALSGGAVLGLLSSDDLWGAAGIAAVLCFLAAAGVRISGAGQRAEKRWYDARAAAETVKSLSWQYAVRGEAFRSSDPSPEATFVSRLQGVLGGLPHLNIPAATASNAGATDTMRALRGADQAERCRSYREHRVDDQVGWYGRKASWNKARSRWWSASVIGIELAAVCLGVLRVAGRIDLDLLGVFGAVAAGFIAWIQAKNYTELSESYAVTSHDVALVSEAVHSGVPEDAWAQSVHDAEGAFSREHTMWLARKQGRQV